MKNYSTQKSQFISKQMNDGKTNKQARNEWNKGPQKEWDARNNQEADERGWIPPGPEWEDYAHTAEDL